MINKFLILCLSVFTLASCNAQKSSKKHTKKTTKVAKKKTTTSSAEKTATEENMFYFNEGENRFLEDQKINITFNKVLEDSRCPVDVQCIMAGNATVELQLMGLQTRPYKITLSTQNNPEKGFNNSFDFNGFTFSLKNLTPLPTQNSGLKENTGKYKIGLKIVKAEVLPMLTK